MLATLQELSFQLLITLQSLRFQRRAPPLQPILCKFSDRGCKTARARPAAPLSGSRPMECSSSPGIFGSRKASNRSIEVCYRTLYASCLRPASLSLFTSTSTGYSRLEFEQGSIRVQSREDSKRRVKLFISRFLNLYINVFKLNGMTHKISSL